MKTPVIKKITSIGCLVAAGIITARADSLIWDPALSSGANPGGAGTWNLNTTTNWFDGISDVTWKDNSAAGTNAAIFSGATAGAVTLNTSLSASNLQFTTSGYTLSGSGTLTLGVGGIDASSLFSGTTTIGVPLSLPSGQQSWVVGAGSTLAVNGAISRAAGATVDFSPSGVTSTTLANDSTGIIGGWATVGGANSTAGDWATISGGSISTYSGYTVISSTSSTSQTGAGASSQNWICGDPTGVNNYITTLTASSTINSLVMQGDVAVNNGVTMTLGSGGLILRGVSRWMLGGTNCYLTTGNSTGELFVHTPNPSSGLDWIIWPIIQDNGPTPLILVKDGVDQVKLGNMSTYTGGTIVKAGILGSTAGALYGNGNAPLGAITPFGTGPITVKNGAQLQLGLNPGNAFGMYYYSNAISVDGGSILEWDAFQRLEGTLAVGAAGVTLGATFDAPWDALNSGFAKGLFIDGLLTGSGPITVQHSGLNTGNTWNSSAVYFTSMGTAAQNTYSGTITVNPFDLTAGSYLYLIGTNALANANIVLTGDNSAGRFGPSTLLFGSGTNLDGLGYATIGSLSGYGSVVLANTLTLPASPYYGTGAGVALTVGYNNSSFTYSGVASGSGGFVKVGTGTMTLAGPNAYTGDTVVNSGTLAVSGSIASSNCIVARGATLDVSAITYALGGAQTLASGGTISGSVNSSSGAKIYAGTDGTYGTNTITGNLNLGSGVTVHVDVGTAVAGTNDRVTVAGTVTASGNSLHVKAPSTASSLEAADYTIISASSVSGVFSSVPVWDVVPANSAHFSVVTSGTAVTLHYSAVAAPSGTATVTPASVTRNQPTKITVNAVDGTEGTVNSVVVDASPIGGSSSLALVAAGGNVWTNSIAPTPDTSAGSKILVATLTDTAAMVGLINIPLTVTVANDVWNGLGPDNNFSSNGNWTNNAAPGYVGDSLQFAGSTKLTPTLDHDYVVSGVLFDTTAGSFNISSAGNTLTLTNGTGVVNNSANVQTLSTPMALAATAAINAASNNIVISSAIGAGASSAGLTKTGNRSLTLSGINSYSGPTIVNGGTLNVSGSIFSPSSAVTIGGAAGKTLLNLTGDIYAPNLIVGNASNAVAAAYQTGGTLTLASGAGDLLSMGNMSGSFGYFSAKGGTITTSGIEIGGGNIPANWPPVGTGDGIMDVDGATINNSGWIVLARGGGPNTGILNVYTGSLTYAGGGLGCNWNGNATPATGPQTAIINIMGGSVTSTSQGVDFRTAGNTGILNLNGGLLEATGVGTGAGVLNFNGGTLQAAVGSSAFMNLNSAYVYSGGAVIDNNGNAITFAQPLLAPAGNGVHAVAGFTGGAGYIAPPIVIVTNGVGDTTGTGATAIAQINPATGTVTNVVITCPGVNYTATPTFLVSGGGATTPATVTGNAPTANASGGVTFIGPGSTSMTGSNTYTGNTTVNAGTVILAQPCLAAGSTVSIASGAFLQLDFATTNTVTALVLGGVSQPTGVYNSTTGAPYIIGTGSIEVNPIANYSTNLSFSVIGNTMTISWPTTHLGWFLQVQTNSLSTGLSTNWVDIAGTDGLTSKQVTIDAAAPTVFYRLRHP
jgi:autotransporter-associated beta strand protein